MYKVSFANKHSMPNKIHIDMVQSLKEKFENTALSYSESIYKVLDRQFAQAYKTLFKDFGVNIKEFSRYAKELDSKEYLQKVYETVMPTLSKAQTPEDADNCFEMIQTLDVYYCMQTDKKLSLHLSERTLDMEKIAEEIKLDITSNTFDGLTGFRLSFAYPDKTYADVTIQVSPMENNFSYKGEIVDGVLFTIVKGDKIMGAFHYLKDYPKHIFVTHTIPSWCTSVCKKNCGLCLKTALEHHPDVPEDFPNDENMPVECCRPSLSQVENGRCLIKSLSPMAIIKIAAYVHTMYNNRKLVTRKNSPMRRTYENNHQISVEPTEYHGEQAWEERIISLDKYSAYEKAVNTHAGSKHSSHKAPIEHERRGHQRIYRNADGSIRKIVEIKPSVINKGKGGEIIYKTSLPKK